ncbi:hypothetical protein BRCON_2303 [Candidatus Sumerlaea chitinivorans]|uniref:Uncharacterized protein n=1 Tax=Sumerlaea chitinivorans TaxID=2250252 RepID=A0A2Z4Y788_SUMC1|nr:hypothetical protein BRCON_2303 [Candidatus Sumerlaea chitinivorans]
MLTTQLLTCALTAGEPGPPVLPPPEPTPVPTPAPEPEDPCTSPSWKVDPGSSITLCGIIDVITTNGCCHDPEPDMTPEKWARLLGLRLSASDQDLRIYYHGIQLPDGTNWTTQTCKIQVIDDEVTTRIEYGRPEGDSQVKPLTLTQATTYTLNFVADNPQRFEMLGGLAVEANARETTGVTIKVVVKPVRYRVPACLSDTRSAQRAGLTSRPLLLHISGIDGLELTYYRMQHVATRFPALAKCISGCEEDCFTGTANFQVGTVRDGNIIEGVALAPEIKVSELISAGISVNLQIPTDELIVGQANFSGVLAKGKKGLYVTQSIFQVSRVYYVEKFVAYYRREDEFPNPYVLVKNWGDPVNTDAFREMIDVRKFYLVGLTYTSQPDSEFQSPESYPQCASFGKEDWQCTPPQLRESFELFEEPF